MEDVLEVYHRSYEDKEVLVCLDETSKQLWGRLGNPVRRGLVQSRPTIMHTSARG